MQVMNKMSMPGPVQPHPPQPVLKTTLIQFFWSQRISRIDIYQYRFDIALLYIYR
jgi:hypothetical protein